VFRCRRAAVQGLACAAAVTVVSCATSSAPSPTQAAVPTATVAPPALPEPAHPEPTLDPASVDQAEIENAFLSNVDDVIAEAADLAATPCAELTAMTRDNPGMLPTIRGFAATLKRLGTSQAVLDTEPVKTALSDLDRSMGELEGALSVCGISQR
jgi:hypothetical protein